MSETVTIDPALINDAYNQALDTDAAAHDAAPPPPRVPWLNDDGSARWGYKANGEPRKAKPGTGRPPRDDSDKPRTSDKPPPEPGTPAEGAHNPQSGGSSQRDYTEDIGGALTMVWMGLASVPWTRGHAAVFRAQTPAMVPAWNTAAQQNAKVRYYVEKLSGEGSWAWVIPVTIVTAPLLTGFWEVTKNRSLRANLAAQTERDFAEFIVAQAKAAGMEVPEPEAQQDSEPQAA